MSCTVMYGKPVVDAIIDELLSNKIVPTNPCIVTIGLVGNDEWQQYVNSLSNSANRYGCNVINKLLDADIAIEDFASVIASVNCDNKVNGILLQQPLPYKYRHLSNMLAVDKDIDALTQRNIYSLYCNNENILPATPHAVIKLLEYYGVELEGKNVVIVGRGMSVGKPLSLMLTNRNATVTLCHTKTKNLHEICKNSDIIISACGVPQYLNETFVNNNSVVVDVGLSFVDGKTCGDVDMQAIEGIVKYASPVPGGIGPITRACLFSNVVNQSMKKG